jgi:hypothetical protein
MGSPRAGRKVLVSEFFLVYFSWVFGLGFWKGKGERRTECFNGFGDGVEGGLGGAIWLLLGRHCKIVVW